MKSIIIIIILINKIFFLFLKMSRYLCSNTDWILCNIYFPAFILHLCAFLFFSTSHMFSFDRPHEALPVHCLPVPHLSCTLLWQCVYAVPRSRTAPQDQVMKTRTLRVAIRAAKSPDCQHQFLSALLLHCLK